MDTASTSKRFGPIALSIACVAFATACMPLGGNGLQFDSSQPEMVAFGSCGELESFLKQQAVTKANWQQTAFNLGSAYNPNGFQAAAPVGSVEPGTEVPEPPSIPFDETNLQEAGVDEADIFKVDGTHAFALHGNRLIIIGAVGTPAPEPTPSPNGGILQEITDARVVSELELIGRPLEMFLDGNFVVVIAHGTFQEAKLLVDGAAETVPDRTSGAGTLKAIVVDVTDRGNPEIVRQVAVDGDYLSARRIGNHVYMVANAAKALTGPSLGESVSNESTWLFNRTSFINSARLEQWMPHVYDTGNPASGINPSVNQADCASTYASKATNGDEALGIFSFDFTDQSSPIKNATVLGEGAVVYSSKESIVVALTNYGALKYGSNDQPSNDGVSLLDGIDWGGDDIGFDIPNDDEPADDEPFDSFDEQDTAGREITYLHRFELGENGDVWFQATGAVEGWLLNQFSISEHRGYVRVATQIARDTSDAESMVFVLQPRDKGGILSAPAGPATEFLDVVGQLRGIGLQEELYATRFQGDMGYLVTFRETDPLWVVDLTQPTEPRLRGHLVVPGYSTYLHPIEDKRLLAIGRAGLSDGIKLSIFDVSNLDAPRALDEQEEGTASSDSEALQEHRSFRYIADRQLMLVPMTHTGERGLYAYYVGDNRLEQVGRIDHRDMTESISDDRTVRRAYRIGDYLYAYSSAGVTISSLDSLELVVAVDLEDN